MDELLLCPFCGSNADCIDCDNGYFCFCRECRGQSNNYPTYEEAINKWNTRPSPWISVKEQIPLFQRELLLIVLDEDNQYLEIGFLRHTDKNNMIFLDKRGYPIINKVTNWQPLLTSPKETEQ